MASTITITIIWLFFWVLCRRRRAFFCRRKTKEDNSLQVGREMAQGSQGLSFALVSRGTVVLAEHA